MTKPGIYQSLIATAAGIALITGTPARAIDPVAPVTPAAAPQETATDTAPATSTQDVIEAATSRGGGVLGGIFGCAASGNKQTIGAVAGGALGGLLGNRVAGSGSRTLGTILGGAIGAAAGSFLGCKLQRNDQAKAERAVQEALAKNQNQTWQSDDTGASGSVQVGSAAGGRLADLTFARGVEPATSYTQIGATYAAASTANIRSAPNAKSATRGQLTAGTQIWVPASVKGQPWLLVSQNNVAQGYVSAPLLKRAQTATAASSCKLIKQTIAQPGAGEETETLQACKGANGDWVVTRV